MPKTTSSKVLLNPGMEGFEEISIPSDRDEAFLCYEILSNNFSDDEEKSIAIENLHVLTKSYPKIADLYALLIIGYRGLSMDNQAIRILRKVSVRFENNLTITLLLSLYRRLTDSKKGIFDPKTLTQSLIQNLIKVKETFHQKHVDLALNIIEEMLYQGENHHQMGHWAIGEALYLLALETGLDPVKELKLS